MDLIITAACWRWTSRKNQANLERISLLGMQAGWVSFRIWHFRWRLREFCVIGEWMFPEGVCMGDGQWKRPIGGLSHQSEEECPYGTKCSQDLLVYLTCSCWIPSKPLSPMWSDFWAEASTVWCVQNITQLPICARYKARILPGLSVSSFLGPCRALATGTLR